MRRKLGIAFMLLGVLLLSGAIILLGYNEWDNYRAGVKAADIQSALESAISGRQAEQGDSSSETDPEGSDSENGGSGLADQSAEDEEEIYAVSAVMDTVEINGDEYIGTLTIPSLDLELPVMSEWSYAGMKTAPGRYGGSVWTDDLVICGHNYARHFGNLKYLEAGDALYFTDVNGNVFSYEVKEVVILQPTDLEEMVSKESGDWDLTLFTCTIGGRTRVTVRCSRTD